MNKVEVIPGLVLDEAMYEAAADGIARYASEVPFSWERFIAAREWTKIPDPWSRLVKIEMVLSRNPDRKLNLWYSSDLRGDGKPEPHDHRWSFTSHILTGDGYTEDRYELSGRVVSTEYNVAHQAGTVNVVPDRVLHEVTEIHGEPGRTMTLMVCEPATRDHWGYLDVDSGIYRPAPPDPGFTARLRAMNPHLY